MSSKKHKGWRTIIEERLSALEHAVRIRTNKPEDTSNRLEAGDLERLGAQPPAKIRSGLKRSLKYAGIALTLFATSLGIVTGYLALVPKVTIVESEPLNPVDPFSVQFVVSNEGPLGINKVSFECLVTAVEYKNRPDLHFSNNTISGGKRSEFFKNRMQVGERGTVSCPWSSLVSVNTPIGNADVIIMATFRPDFTWWHAKRAYRFVTMADPSGNLHWLPQPVESK